MANTSATAGNVIVQANTNGVLYGGAIGENTSTETTDLENISFSFGLRVKPNCCQNTNVSASLTFENTGISAVFSNVNVTVEVVH